MKWNSLKTSESGKDRRCGSGYISVTHKLWACYFLCLSGPFWVCKVDKEGEFESELEFCGVAGTWVILPLLSLYYILLYYILCTIQQSPWRSWGPSFACLLGSYSITLPLLRIRLVSCFSLEWEEKLLPDVQSPLYSHDSLYFNRLSCPYMASSLAHKWAPTQCISALNQPGCPSFLPRRCYLMLFVFMACWLIPCHSWSRSC